ncbi:MAG TPA: HXXEE domain-containing protein [Pyrinomonadaceae bacterium]|nr:HXXEE domain-containing protein [Pyrinomonadaceae bacterium]
MRRPVEKWVRWGWLFPATYGVHIVEEWRGGEGFPAWFSRVMGARLTAEQFLALNAYALAGMTLGVVLTLLFRQMRWLLVGFGAAVLINGLAHIGASALTRSYSPGVVSGALLWLPLGAWMLAAGRKDLSRRDFSVGVVVGIAMHVVVTMLAYFGS